jgi:hypothetical protein
MRKHFDIAGLEGLEPAAMIKTNGGAKGGQSALHSNAGTALTDALALLTANGANQKAIDALTKNIAKHP